MRDLDEIVLPRVTPADQAVNWHVSRYDAVDVDRERVHRAVGIQVGRPAHRRWVELADNARDELKRLMRPRALVRIDAVSRLEARRLELESGAAFEGAVGRFLQHSEFIATFIATIGSGLERLSRRWMRGTQVMRAVIIDAIASEAAEETAGLCYTEVRDWARSRGLSTTPAYSPGYCGMHVRQQRMLFASLPARELGVRLTPSCLMVPVKSVSGLIGIAPADKVGPTRYPCEMCNHPDCMQRRSPFDSEFAAEFDWEKEETTPKRVG
ncbi:MAG: hypothetical protein JXO22_10020 [Phycisphaerae bacterium]|nr:hypothetical protein [Phycisphaerae bacterium]